MVVTTGKWGGELVKDKADQVYGDKRFDFGWWAHNADDVS